MQRSQPVHSALKALRERSGYSVRELAESIGKASSTYASYERETYKKAYLPIDLVQSLEKAMVGRGDPPIASAEVLRLAGVMRGGDLRSDVAAPPLGPNNIVVPELDVRPQAGAGAEDITLEGDEAHSVVAHWTMPASYLRAFAEDPSMVRIVRVAGDSMEPEYPAGERVAVDTSHRTPSPPGVYVLWDGLGLVLKRVELLMGSNPRRIRLSSINPGYPPYEVPLTEVQINGRVIGKWTWK